MIFEYTTEVAAEPEQVFDFLARPRNLLRVMPPSPKIELIAVPERLQLGSTFTAKVSKFCFHATSTSEVTWFEEGQGFTDVQRRGPFGQFEHTHTVEPHPTGTLMRDRIVAAPPTGWLGLLINEHRLRRELDRTFAYRQRRMNELFPREQN
jgi:ligand-binding SRPBCC domain-containing protein